MAKRHSSPPGSSTRIKPGEGAAMQARKTVHGPPPMSVYRAVQDALDRPDLIPGQSEALIVRTFKAISEGIERRDHTGKPDSVTLGFVKLVAELYFGRNGDGKPGEFEKGTRVFRLIYDQPVQSLGLKQE